MSQSRRHFLKNVMRGMCATCIASQISFPDNRLLGLPAISGNERKYVKEAMHYEKKEELKVLCKLCPKECSVADLERGYCGVRENMEGTYFTLVHSRPCTYQYDPIEKKPLFHFLPGTKAFSIATAGCNMECKFCQNWEISQFRPEQLRSFFLPPRDVHKAAKINKCRSIAYTYTEPVIYYEYVFDTAKLGKETGVRSVVISNGYIQEKPIVELCQHLDGIKIDLKAFTEKFYKETCSGELKPVLDALQAIKKTGIWLEIVVLIVPTLNDSESEIKQMSLWIGKNLGSDVPVHFTRFHPTYKIKNLPPTPVSTLERSRKIALSEGLHYVYTGNVRGHAGENTYCPSCRKVVIKRYGYVIVQVNMKGGKCSYCGLSIPGVWS